MPVALGQEGPSRSSFHGSVPTLANNSWALYSSGLATAFAGANGPGRNVSSALPDVSHFVHRLWFTVRVEEKWETKMAADPNNGVRYLLRGRIADFGRTKTFVAIIAFIFGMTVGHTIANVANLSRTEAIRAQLDELRMRIDSLKDAQKK